MRLSAPGGVSVVSMTLAHLAARRVSDEALGAALAVALPADWPPEHIGERFWDWSESALTAAPEAAGWLNWFVISEGVLSGAAGFKGPPDADGVVELGYSVVPSRQRRGIAREAVALLVDHACLDPTVRAVAAETLPSLPASIAVAERAGLTLASTCEEPEIGLVLRNLRARPSANRAPEFSKST